MARKSRNFRPHCIYHVSCRVSRGEAVFVDGFLAEAWSETLAETARLFRQQILGYCLLPDRYHLILRGGELPLWRSMARLQGRVAKLHNRRRGVLGSLWQGRYKAWEVNEGKELCEALSWVHFQPVAEGLVEAPEAYRLSGHLSLMADGSDGVDADAAWMAIGASAAARYRARLSSLEASRLPGLAELAWWNRPPEELSETPAPKIELPEVVRWFEESRELGPGRIKCRSQSRIDCRNRQLLTMLLVGLGGFKACELGRVIGRSQGTLSRWLEVANRRLSHEPGFRQELQEVRLAYDELQDSH